MIYLRQALNALPYYFLEDLIQELLGKVSVPNRAAQVRLLAEALERRETLRSLWERLRHEEQEAVRLSLYNNGKLDLITYEALYGDPPEKGFSGLYGYRRKPQYLKLFFLSGWELPIEMIEPLKEWVDPPQPFQPRGLLDLPPRVSGLRGELALSVVETEQAVWHDFTALLRLAQKGTFKISETTHMPSAGAVRVMQKELLVLDYYDVGDVARAADTIRPVGLTFALLAGGLAKVEGSTLVPTRVGLEWLAQPSAAALRDAFDGWVESSFLDEIRRIGSLRGFQSSGAEFTNPVTRRRAILSAFKHYPPGEWIQVEEFFKTIKLCGHNFLVEPKNTTAIQVQGYGLLDNATYHTYWRAVNGQYVLVLLMEYLAAFGAIDFGCIDPHLAQYDLGGLGEYVQHPFSRYDGLVYFRLTPLGLYLLGQREDYAPAERLDAQQSGLEFAGGLLIGLRRPETLNPNDRAMLERFAEKLTDEVYRLDGKRAIEASEQGLKLSEALNFLQRKAGLDAPQEVQDFFERLKKRSQVLARKNDAVLYQVKDVELMKSLLKDDVLGELCVLAEDHQLVVPVKHEAAFRRRLHELEAGVKS
jgi:hypothetical protein